MHILDAIRCEGKTKEKSKRLCKDYGYSPTHIGAAILRACGYDVRFFYNGDISVKDEHGNILYHETNSYDDF